MTDGYSFKPASKKQWSFLKSDAQIVVYGGAMGGGKTYNGLLKHLLYVDNPHYRGLVVRKNSSTIMRSGFLFDEAEGLYRAFAREKGIEVKVGRKYQKFKWESGAEIVFTHLATDEDAENFRGGQFSFAMLDEATELDENHVLRVFSRIRSKAGIPPQMVLTCNPNPDSFIRRWIGWWLYPEGHEFAGRPDPDKDGVVRYFLRIDNEMCWGDSKKELIDRYGNPDLPDDHDQQVKPISFCFYPATIFDNPPLIKLNPMYLANLMSLKDVQKERDLWGNWNIRESTSNFWKREWITEITEVPAYNEFTKICRVWDFADKMPSSTNPSPDYTVSMKMGLKKNGDFVIIDVTKNRVRAGDWLPHILEVAEKDGKNVDIIIPQDPGVQAKLGTQQQLLKPLNSLGYYATFKQTNQKKLERFRPFSAASQNGYVYVVKGCGNDLWNKIYHDNNFWYKEMEAFTGERKRGEAGHDDICDVASDGYMYLANAGRLPAGFLTGLKGFDTSNKSPLLNIN